MDLSKYMRTVDAALVLGYHPKYVSAQASRGRFGAVRVGRDWWLLRSAVLAYRDKRKGVSKHNPVVRIAP